MAKSNFDKWCRLYGLEFIRKLAEDGFSDEEIAKRAHITMIEYDSWKRRYKKFYDAIEIGRREADFSVVEALYKRAVGYSVATKKTHKLKHVDFDPATGKKLREYEELAFADDEDHIPPDLRAGIFWLKNRQPERWSEKGLGFEPSEGGVIELPCADTIDSPDIKLSDGVPSAAWTLSTDSSDRQGLEKGGKG